MNKTLFLFLLIIIISAVVIFCFYYYHTQEKFSKKKKKIKESEDSIHHTELFKKKIQPLINIVFYILQMIQITPIKRRKIIENIFEKNKFTGDLAKGYIRENYMKNFLNIEDDVYSASIHLDSESKYKFIRNLIRLANTFPENKSELISIVRKISLGLSVSENDFSELLYSFEYKTAESEMFGQGDDELEKAMNILEVTGDMTFEEIKVKYRNLVRRYHPDKTSNLTVIEQERAQEKMRELNWAYTRIKKEFSDE
ncbi:MAG: J domain-containing protein [bacterium]|nr:J domain-containing protein [bacterium]